VEYHTGQSLRPSYLPVNVLSPSFWHMKEQNGESARKIKVFKHEPTSNLDYNQYMDINFEGMDKDEADALKMMSLHISNVPDDTWNLPRGVDYDWSVPNFRTDKHLWETDDTFLSDAKGGLNKESSHADIPMRFVQ
jgi:hypothetical protein